MEIFRPDGTTVTDYGNGTVLKATVNGVEWAYVLRGKTTEHWVTQNGMLLLSDISSQSSWTALENGAYHSRGQLSVEPGSEQYRCSGSTLREFISNGSEELSRQPAVRPTFTSAGS